MKIPITARLLAALTLQLCSLIATAQSCGDVVVSHVTLTSDLHCTTGYYALDVQANGVTIDLNGHTLSGTTALAGITVVGYDGVTIKGPGKISGFWTGVNAVRADNLTVTGLKFDSMGAGINHNHASGGIIADNKFNGIAGIGVSLRATAHAHDPVIANLVQGNLMKDVIVGVELCGDIAFDNEISNNKIKAFDIGINLTDQTHDNVLQGNAVSGAGVAALALRNSSNNDIAGEYYRDNWVGVWLLSQSSSGCHTNSSLAPRTAYNRMDSMSLHDNQTAVLAGGGSASGDVLKNRLLWSKLYDNNVGVDLRSNTIKNIVQYNTFHGTLNPIIDAGVNNVTSPNFP